MDRPIQLLVPCRASMFFLLPLGLDRTIRRFPWLTVGLMGSCLLAHLIQVLFVPRLPFMLGYRPVDGLSLGLVTAAFAHGGWLPDLQLTDHTLNRITLAALRSGQLPLAVRAGRQLLESHPQSPHLPEAMWKIALAQEKAGHPERARNTLTTLADRFPADHFGELARERLGLDLS